MTSLSSQGDLFFSPVRTDPIAIGSAPTLLGWRQGLQISACGRKVRQLTTDFRTLMEKRIKQKALPPLPCFCLWRSAACSETTKW